MERLNTALDTSGVLQRAEASLRRCEAEIQRLVIDAASLSKYDEIDRLTSIARSLNDMALGAASAQRLDKLAEVGALEPVVQQQPAPSRRKKTTAKAGYPRFARDGDDLVKTGWSKKKREEYIHRARRNQAESIVVSLAARSGNGAIIPVDDILAVRDLSGSEIPGYQVYLTLAWLRKERLVERRGRNGYVVHDPEGLEDTFADLWSALSEYKA